LYKFVIRREAPFNYIILFAIIIAVEKSESRIRFLIF